MTGAGTANARSADVSSALEGLRGHPQDHGWRRLYEVIAQLLRQESPPLLRVLDTFAAGRPNVSPTHAATLLGIGTRMAIEHELGDSRILVDSTSFPEVARTCEELIHRHEPSITNAVLTRQNSFTNIRRFLVPQVVIARYFTRLGVERPNFLDVGTGLGILPKQLNSRTVFERFAPDLVWPFGVPAYQEAPLGERYGLDRAPLPDLAWVRSCYGPSGYYDRLFQELLWVAETVRAERHEVSMVELDILASNQLGNFVRDHKIQVANCGFVLYQYEQAVRAQIIAAIVDNLTQPGLMISMEPNADLTEPGCHVHVYRHQDQTPVRFAFVTDGHFIGQVLSAEDYHAFTADCL